MMNPDRQVIFPAGEFAGGAEAFSQKMLQVKALVFDWDGVFNRGEKTGSSHSGFSEADSMGINMLRFAMWLHMGKTMPVCAIISGAGNEMAKYYAQREHFHAVMTGVKQKGEALMQLQEQYGFCKDETAFFFDDIIDLPAALLSGLRVYFPHQGTPLTNKYVREHHLFDYMPGCGAGDLGLREVCEIMIHSLGRFEEVIGLRMRFDGLYQEYLLKRNEVSLLL
jgi:3-deoxy-D-manno-octulosonate 8-phosphate phosphatase (KDO 8-P phosphatase)